MRPVASNARTIVRGGNCQRASTDILCRVLRTATVFAGATINKNLTVAGGDNNAPQCLNQSLWCEQGMVLR
jgi:hypothetical protein